MEIKSLLGPAASLLAVSSELACTFVLYSGHRHPKALGWRSRRSYRIRGKEGTAGLACKL